jgi:hypothetical protein
VCTTAKIFEKMQQFNQRSLLEEVASAPFRQAKSSAAFCLVTNPLTMCQQSGFFCSHRWAAHIGYIKKE